MICQLIFNSRFFNRIQTYLSKVASEIEPNGLSTFFVFYLFLTLVKDICEKLHRKVNQMICLFISTPVGTMIYYLFLTSFKIFAKVASESERNDLSTFFIFGGNNDILSCFYLIQRYLRKLYKKVNQMICQLFSI